MITTAMKKGKDDENLLSLEPIYDLRFEDTGQSSDPNQSREKREPLFRVFNSISLINILLIERERIILDSWCKLLL